jgi:hypothetical protein
VLAAEDLRGEAVDAYDAQELQLLRLAIHGWDGIWWWVDGWIGSSSRRVGWDWVIGDDWMEMGRRWRRR